MLTMIIISFISCCYLHTGGEPLIGLPAVLAYPFYDPKLGQLFPFRTMSMIISLLSHVIVSLAARWMFISKWLPANWDLLRCFHGNHRKPVVPALSACRSIPTISQCVNETRRKNEGFPSDQLDFRMGRIPRPKLRRNSSNGVCRKDVVPHFVQQ